MRALTSLRAFVFFSVCATAAHGDGGSMLLHQDAGPFTVTVFVARQPLTAGKADLSVMVQDRANGEVLLDPEVDVTTSLAEGAAPQATVHLTKANAGNRLLQQATISLLKAGKWRLSVRVRRAKDAAEVSTLVAVAPDRSRTAVIWFYLLLPLAVIALFLFHQSLKERR